MDLLKIERFLDSGYGNGDGYGSSNGNGSGYGYGYGNGNGDGTGIKSINGMVVYTVDGMPTVFTNIHRNVDKGYFLERNVYLKPCYIVKGNGYFAHGETLAEAQNALEEKILNNMAVDKKIARFREKFPDISKEYPAKVFYDWHHTLTGSCEMGRNSFAASHNINVETAVLTVKEFIELTEHAYCGEIIRKLRESYDDE